MRVALFDARATADLAALMSPLAAGERDMVAHVRALHASERRQVWLQGVYASLALLASMAGWRLVRRRSPHERAQPDGRVDGQGMDMRGLPSPRLLAQAGPRLRQPLHAMNLLAGSLSRDAMPEQREALSRLEQRVRELAGVIEEVEQMSQWLHQDLRSVVSVNELFSLLRPGLLHLQAERGVELTWHAGGLRFRGDPVLSVRLLNLLVEYVVRNAQRTVVVRAWRDAGHVRIFIGVDSGSLDRAATEALGGWLRRQRDEGRDHGLALAADIADLLGLEVEVHRTAMSGLALTVDLPFASGPSQSPDIATLASLSLLGSAAACRGQEVERSR